jgi:hypothetical protein
VNPETAPLQVRYGTAQTTHLKFVNLNGRRVAFEVTDPARGQFARTSLTRKDVKRLARLERKARIRAVKARDREVNHGR